MALPKPASLSLIFSQIKCATSNNDGNVFELRYAL